MKNAINTVYQRLHSGVEFWEAVPEGCQGRRVGRDQIDDFVCNLPGRNGSEQGIKCCNSTNGVINYCTVLVVVFSAI